MLLLYNALIGIVAALVRVLVSAGFGLLLLFRLDKVVLMKGLEFADFGELVSDIPDPYTRAILCPHTSDII